MFKCKPLFLAEKARLVARNLLHGLAIKSNVRNFEVKLKFLSMFNIHLLYYLSSLGSLKRTMRRSPVWRTSLQPVPTTRTLTSEACLKATNTG